MCFSYKEQAYKEACDMTHCVADLKMREAGTAEPVLPPPIVKSKAANLLLSRLLNQNQNFFWGGPSKILDFC
jgi:hypothetical protein